MVGWSFIGYASSHREAPLICADPVADNTDVYAFRSPDDPNTITIIANYQPFQFADGRTIQQDGFFQHGRFDWRKQT